MKPKLLVISTRVPFPLFGGDRIRLFNTCKALTRCFAVDLLALSEERVETESLMALAEIGVKVKIFEISSLRHRFSALGGIFSDLPIQVKYYYFRNVQRWIDGNIQQYDTVLCNHIRSAEYIRNKPIPKVIDLVDAISLNYYRAKKYTSGMWKWIYRIEDSRVLRYETEIIGLFDKAIIVSDIDKMFLVEHAADPKKITIIPVAVNASLLEIRPCVENESIVYLGKMDTVSNADAAIYFGKEIFPQLRERFVNIEFLVVGSNPTKNVKRLDHEHNIMVTGKVENHLEYLSRAKVVVAPMRFGAGMQTKILEAMALGKPVVTTTIGAEGIEGRDGIHFLVADTAEDFCRKVSMLWQDEQLRRRVGAAARELVCEKYTWDVVGKSLLAVIEETLNMKKNL